VDQTSLRRPICAAGQPQYGSLKGGIPTLPGWPFGVIDLPKVGMATTHSFGLIPG